MIKTLLALLTLGAVMLSCSQPHSSAENFEPPKPRLDSLRLALDWSPNVLHAPIIWAEMEGYFEEEGLAVEYFSPEIDDYTKKPIKRSLDREVDLCIGPSEHLFFYTKAENHAVAVASLLQDDQSCFVAKPLIKSPKGLSGKTYLGYKTPLEEEVLKGMITNDGGNPTFEMKTPGRLDVWEAFLNGQGDVAWVFSHWEAAMAKYEGNGLRKFYPGDYGVPYGYSSVIMALEDLGSNKEDKVKAFLRSLEQSTRDLLARDDSTVARKLCEYMDHPNFDNPAFIEEAWLDIKPALTGDQQGDWGQMSVRKWADWLAWVRQKDLEGKENIQGNAEDFFTNDFLSD